MKRYIRTTTLTEVYYKERGRHNRWETDDAIIGLEKSAGVYTVSVIDKATNTLKMKQYHKKEAVNNFTEKYGVHINF